MDKILITDSNQNLLKLRTKGKRKYFFFRFIKLKIAKKFC